MPSDALRVTAAHLHQWAATHNSAAAEMAAAAGLVSGVDRRVRISHGPVASPTAQLIGRIEETRCIAGRRVAAESEALQRSLDSVAHAYTATDSVAGAELDRFPR